MPLEEFEITLSSGVRPQTCALDRAATGTGEILHDVGKLNFKVNRSGSVED
jgi:hypothetical protein